MFYWWTTSLTTVIYNVYNNTFIKCNVFRGCLNILKNKKKGENVTLIIVKAMYDGLKLLKWRIVNAYITNAQKIEAYCIWGKYIISMTESLTLFPRVGRVMRQPIILVYIGFLIINGINCIKNVFYLYVCLPIQSPMHFQN